MTPTYPPFDRSTHTCLQPQTSMTACLYAACDRYPDRIALDTASAVYTFAELRRAVERTAKVFSDHGYKPGDVISICLGNVPEAVLLFYAANRVGLICNMIHPLSPPALIGDYMRATDSVALFIHPKAVPALRASEFRHALPRSMRQIIAVGDGEPPVQIDGLCAFDEWCAADGAFDLPPLSDDDSRISVYLHSGGTTGTPKTIMLTDRNFNALASQAPYMMNVAPDVLPEADLSMVTILPLFHGYGLCIGMHMTLINNLRLILVDRFRPDALARIIAKKKPTFLAGVPTLFEGIMSAPSTRAVDYSSFHGMYCGGDSLPHELKDRFDAFLRERGGTCRLREGYGLTEVVTVCCLTPVDEAARHGIGKPLLNMAMKIVDPETGATCPPGEMGEIYVTGPTVMQGYLNDLKSSTDVMREDDEGRLWIASGDLGTCDEDGFFTMRGRLKRMIKVSGIPIFPAEIESLVAKVPGVRYTAAIGVPHPYKMNVIKLFVVPEDDSDLSALEESIFELINRSLLSYALPQSIEFRDELPLTPIGKVDILALEREHKERTDG